MRPRIKRTIESLEQRIWNNKRELIRIEMSEKNINFKTALREVNFSLQMSNLDRLFA